MWVCGGVREDVHCLRFWFVSRSCRVRVWRGWVGWKEGAGWGRWGRCILLLLLLLRVYVPVCSIEMCGQNGYTHMRVCACVCVWGGGAL